MPLAGNCPPPLLAPEVLDIPAGTRPSRGPSPVLLELVGSGCACAHLRPTFQAKRQTPGAGKRCRSYLRREPRPTGPCWIRFPHFRSRSYEETRPQGRPRPRAPPWQAPGGVPGRGGGGSPRPRSPLPPAVDAALTGRPWAHLPGAAPWGPEGPRWDRVARKAPRRALEAHSGGGEGEQRAGGGAETEVRAGCGPGGCWPGRCLQIRQVRAGRCAGRRPRAPGRQPRRDAPSAPPTGGRE